MRGCFLSLLGAAFATLVMTGVFNYAVDFDGTYLLKSAEGPGVVRRFVARLRTEPAGLLVPDQTRLFKLELARQSTADCYLIGSSHVFQTDAVVTPGLFQGCREVANLAVIAGGFEDFVTMAALLSERPGSAHLFVEMPLWALRPNPHTGWAEDSQSEYDHARSLLGLPPRPFELWILEDELEQLVSADYLIENFKSVFTGDLRRRNILAGLEAAARADEVIILPTGRFLYPDLKPAAPGQLGDGTINLKEPALDAKTIAEFESVVGFLLDRGFRLTFVITPYHPSVAACKAPAVCRCQKAVESYVRASAAHWGAPVIGGFDPAPLGITERDFQDIQHLMLSGLAKLKPQTTFRQAETAR
jgi:hypothetical protein